MDEALCGVRGACGLMNTCAMERIFHRETIERCVAIRVLVIRSARNLLAFVSIRREGRCKT